MRRSVDAYSHWLWPTRGGPAVHSFWRAGLPVARRAAAAAWKSRRGGSARRRAGNSWPLSCLPSPYRVASHRCLRAAGTAGVRAGVSATSAALHRFRYPARMLRPASRRPRQDHDWRWAAPSTWLGLPLGARTTRSPATTLWAALKSQVRGAPPERLVRVSQGAERRSRETSCTVCLINATPGERNQGQLTAPAPRWTASSGRRISARGREITELCRLLFASPSKSESARELRSEQYQRRLLAAHGLFS